jgi:hypothetical protein
MERVRHKSIVSSSSRQQLTQKKFYKGTDGLRSAASAKQYKWHFDKFLEFTRLTEGGKQLDSQKI